MHTCMHSRPTAPAVSQILFKLCIEQFHVTSFSVHVCFAAAMWCTTVLNGRKALLPSQVALQGQNRIGGALPGALVRPEKILAF